MDAGRCPYDTSGDNDGRIDSWRDSFKNSMLLKF